MGWESSSAVVAAVAHLGGGGGVRRGGGVRKTINFNVTTELNISFFATNLLDEIARNHTSFVKDDVPLPGTNYGVNFNLIF